MDGLILDDLQPHPPPEYIDIVVGPSMASRQNVRNTHVENVDDLDSDDYVV